jgi:hypothetical protein
MTLNKSATRHASAPGRTYYQAIGETAALPPGFRIERHNQRMVLHCPAALGRQLAITHQARAPGATVEPLFDAALYLPGRQDFVVFATGDLCDSYLSRLHPTEPKLWVKGACFELSADELAAVIAVFGPLMLRGAS